MNMYDFKIMKIIEIDDFYFNYSLPGSSDSFTIKLSPEYESYIRSCAVPTPSVKSSYIRDLSINGNVVYKNSQLIQMVIEESNITAYFIYDYFANPNEYISSIRECKLNELL
jgi:hypothetical protein